MPHSAKNWPRVKVSVVLGDSTWTMPSSGVRVQPVEAASGFDEGAVRGRHRLEAGYADAVGDDPRLAVHEDRQMGVDVGDGLLAGVALDPVHRLPGGRGGQRGQLGPLGDRNAFRSLASWPGPATICSEAGIGVVLTSAAVLDAGRVLRGTRDQDDDEDDHQDHHQRTPVPEGRPHSLGPQFGRPTFGCFPL